MVSFIQDCVFVRLFLLLINKAVVVDDKTFTLNGDNVSYRFHVNDTTGDLLSDHFGGSITGEIPTDPWPDHGRL